MQQTRRDILDILRRRGQASVDELVEDLVQMRGHITSVTVRHHLGRLQQEGLVTTGELRRKHSPGRPQHIYGLTPQAESSFPNNYQRLAAGLLVEMRRHLPPEGVQSVLEGVAREWATEADLSGLPLQQRMDAIVEYLNGLGYSAHWETGDGCVILHTSNCPYHAVTSDGIPLCEMDVQLVASLAGTQPRCLSQLRLGDETCSYRFPLPPSSTST